jgi:hypothetical protein
MVYAGPALDGACPPKWGSRVFLMDPKDPGLAEMFTTLPPFYAVPGFQPPRAS